MGNSSVKSSKRREAKASLTDSLVAKLLARESEYDVRDGTLKGFYVRVYPSGTKTYRCEYKKGKHFVIGRSTTFTAAQARKRAHKIIQQASDGIDPKATEQKCQQEEIERRQNEMTFKEFLDECYRPYYEATYPKTAYEAIKNLERNFLKEFGELPLQKITQAKILAWRMKRQKMTRKRMCDGQLLEVPISPATVNRNIEQLSGMLTQAVVHKYIKDNPAVGIEKLAAPSHKTRFLSSEEYQRLLQSLDKREYSKVETREHANARRLQRKEPVLPSLKNQFFVDHLKPMVLLALGSGIRFGSLSRLKWDKHIDFTHDNIIISLTADIVKVGKPYDVPLDAETSKILMMWYEQTKALHHGKGWVFSGNKPGSHITTVKRAWNNLKKEAGIENFTWHDQRHDFASQHVMGGTDLYTVMELLGHSDPKTTKKYAHLAVEHKITAAGHLAKRRSEMLNKKNKL